MLTRHATAPVTLEPTLVQMLQDAADIICAGPYPERRFEAAVNLLKSEVDKVNRLASQFLAGRK
jgi:hypothetical protein